MDELKEIARIAALQRLGPYSAQSDAMSALDLIERLAEQIMKLREEAGLA
jgi:hypothetical protein